MSETPIERPLGSGEVAEMFGVSTQAVAKWADEGLLPCFKTPGGQRRFRRADIEKFLDTKPEAVA